MNTTDLYKLFRHTVVDLEEPYLWSDFEVFTYMNEAHVNFTRWGVGISDVSSPITRIQVLTGEEYADMHPSILQVRQATLVSTMRPLDVRNLYDANTTQNDYGMLYSTTSHRPGAVRAMVIGEQKNKCRWVGIPVEDDEVMLEVYRKPKETIVGKDQELEIGDEHHFALLMWMQHLAYAKKDAETFDRGASETNEDAFRKYCEAARIEWERYKHKPRLMQYGGIENYGDYYNDNTRRSW